MKKVSTATAKEIRNFAEQKLTIGLGLGEGASWYCVLNEAGGPSCLLFPQAGGRTEPLHRLCGDVSSRKSAT